MPSTDDDPRSVTYSCSKPISPRPELLYSQIPDALLRGRNPVETLSDRMADMFDIISSSAAGRPTILALSQPLYAPGDILEFDSNNTETVVQQQSDLVIRHDLYLAGNLKPDRARSIEKIDGIVALVMALALAMRHEDRKSVV